ncbi:MULTISPECIES: FAD-dependent oxidoreductase [unclassified Ruegeria]|uniref:FAD-dependent oxidoreductase n=1 Tax=unclassified Ruegeria TaxID=2625375 RepID=UPI001492B389|nr:MULTISPECIES: FAD-dependent oxidoreductase [unclassified Ruegeria]NOD34516.1 enoyl-CoA hydratase [Ruegeria sp. HKCCD7296]NOE40260.1 enoyl-CoA hydratase [Ruegeria sp. HKCCD7319]
MLQSSLVSVELKGDVAWVTVNNPLVNATSTGVRQGLSDAVDAVQGARVAVLCCAGRTFIAGGDMSEFDVPPIEPHLPDVVQKIEDSKVPFVACMHGNVLGGGFEIAMACAWRIAARDTGFGLPEVNVGLIPGAGGTQRLPRLVGMQAAIDMACSGKIMKAEALAEIGGIDLIADDLLDAVSGFVADLPERPLPVSQRTVPDFAPDLFETSRLALRKRAKGQPSPLENLSALGWSVEPFAEGQPKERARHLALRQSAESRALRHAFFAERTVSKPALIKGSTARDITRIAVVGGGLMGAGIATAALNGGLSVTLIEQNAEAASAAQQRVESLLNGAVKRGKISEAQLRNRLTSFQAAESYAVAADAELAIEAVFEDLSVKQSVFAELASHMHRDAILATNTSYLDPVDIFEDVENKARCIGLHFFSPAHVMKLLEIVHTPDTSPEVLATGFALGRKLRKVSVLSGICDGFIGNRMLAAYRREADYLLADGALPYQVDQAMRAFGMPMGPYELQDLTGLQIAWANRKRNAETRNPDERYVTIADQLCEMGRLGQRTGKGWYRYEDGNRKPVRDPEVEALIETYSAEQGITRRSFTEQDISSRILAVLANEGALIVQERIAENAESVDMVQIHGYGFPRWRGGPMNYSKEIGIAISRATMLTVANENPGSWRIADHSGDL